MNTDTAQGKWNEIKGEIRNAWGKLTDNELESVKGNMTAIAGLIQQRYGETKESISEKLEEMFAHGTEKVKETIRGDEDFADVSDETQSTDRDDEERH